MTEFLTLALTSRPPRVPLLVPDPSVTAHSGEPWQAVMSRAIEVASLYWGGADTAFIPVAWDLAQKVTHGDITRVDAYAAAQATGLIVRTLQQMAA